MEIVLISGLSTACLLTAFEGLVMPLRKLRGLVALILSIASSFILGCGAKEAYPIILSATFVGLTLSIIVEQVFSGATTPREARGLPNRVDKL